MNRIDPLNLNPLHSVEDTEKLERLVASMKRGGWIGRPVLALDDGNGYHAWTGSHRIVAARRAELEVIPVELFSPPVQDWEEISASTGGREFGDGDDDDRLFCLEALAKGNDYAAAIALMRLEVETA